LKYFLLLLASFSLSFALDISIKVAKEDFENYSTLHLKHTKAFYCQESLDPLDNVTSIVCVFDKRPSKRFKPLKNAFFSVKSQVKNKKFYLIIKPYEKMKLFPMIVDFSKKEKSFESDVEKADHWMVVGFSKTLPFIHKTAKTPFSINFPINITLDSLPYVGALDIHSKPVSISNVQDVADYLELKNLYNIKKYEQVLELCNEIIENFKDSIFLSDVIIYKIRSLHHLEEPEEVIELSKEFMREYSSNNAMPEVLAYTARAYSKIGLYIDADYFFDRVFDEHSDSRFSKLALIFKAEQLDDAGNAKKAIEYYKKALYSTKDMDIAAYAAFKITEYEVDHKRGSVASKYIAKIADKKSSYFLENRVDSIKMAEELYELKEYKSTYLILKNLLEGLNKSDDDYERLLKELILALSKTDMVDTTLDYIEKYNKTFREGDYSEEVEIAKDSLFFDKKDLNVTAKLAEYDALISKYGEDKIGNKALYKKAKLLFANTKYQDVLDLNQSLSNLETTQYSDISDLLNDSAKELLVEGLDKEQCRNVIRVYKKYTLAPFEDSRVYSCSIKISDYKLAKEIAARYLHVKDFKEREKWLYNYVVALYNLREYAEMIQASDDLLALDTSENFLDETIHRYRFDAYKALGNTNKVIDTISVIEEIHGLNAQDIERFAYMLLLAQKNSDDVMVENYATKVMQIQKRANINSQTPFVEFSLVQSLQRLNKKTQAIDVLKELVKKELSSDNSARAEYLLGSLYLKENKNVEAKKAFENSVKADEKSAWSKLAKDALTLL